VLAGLRDDLLNTRNLGSAAQLRAIASRIGQLTRASDKVQRVIGAQSASLQNLTGLQGHVQDV
jgi:hypothetical protein